MRFLLCGAACLLTGVLALGACGSDDPATPGGGNADGGQTSSGNPSSSGTTPTPSTSVVNTTTESVTVNGTARVYLLSVPKNLDPAKTYPLVMELHGSPGDAKGQAGGLPFERASGSDAIIVYPQALAEDSGFFSWDLSSAAANNADIALLEAMPAAVKAKGYNIDASKVFGYGYSGGGFFLQVYQCLGAKVFRSIVATAGGAPESLKSSQGGPLPDSGGCVQCPGTPIPEIIVFGQNDAAQGGDYQAMCQAEASGCTANSLTATTPTPCQAYQGCRDGQPVTYCNVPGLGHEEWSESIPTAWAFFKTFL